ncbi:MAG: ribulose-phosphate 3-epimerase [Clostridia bacterium]|nr:ribulose-phosphate 3-epimerase [Clostridia bacterium]
MIKVAPSILSADFANMGEAVRKTQEWGADYIHLDVMDGNFVPQITFGAMMCKAIRKYTNIPIDAHLMVNDPRKYIEQFADAGADIVTVHTEADKHIHGTLQKIKQCGMKAGVVLNPATPISACECVIEDCDMILLMSVNPGFGGQKFIPGVVKKIQQLKNMIDKSGCSVDIEIDGGINPETAKLCIEAGANVLVAGNSVFTAQDPARMIKLIRGAE